MLKESHFTLKHFDIRPTYVLAVSSNIEDLNWQREFPPAV